MTVLVRSLYGADLPCLVKMLNDEYSDSYEFEAFSENSLHLWLQGGKLEILVAEEDNQIIGSAAYHNGYWGEEIVWVTVGENPNRKQIENDLVNEAQKRVKRDAVFTAVDAHSPKINEWIERGYKQEGGLYHMVSRLDSVMSLPGVPSDTILRSLRPEEEKDFVETVNAGFETERVKLGTIQLWKTESPPFNEEWVQVAEANRRIVSIVAAKPDTNHNKLFGTSRGYLGPATTLNEYRGKSLASALTVRAMNFLFEKKMDSVALFTSERNTPSVKLLQKIGFKVGHHWKFMRKHL
ncbi:GNAT family N-acetyltransferase [Candidatus Bathyarchaeota archaeon]|nr:GNAT family N-acetyltransferase [Candidatus Bathyarchaeota archaeon]